MTHKNEDLCLYLLSSLLMTFKNCSQHPLHVIALGFFSCLLGRPLKWLIAPEARAETSMAVKRDVQPVSAGDQAHKQSICLRRGKITLPSSPKGSMGYTFP